MKTKLIQFLDIEPTMSVKNNIDNFIKNDTNFELINQKAHYFTSEKYQNVSSYDHIVDMAENDFYPIKNFDTIVFWRENSRKVLYDKKTGKQKQSYTNHASHLIKYHSPYLSFKSSEYDNEFKIILSELNSHHNRTQFVKSIEIMNMHSNQSVMFEVDFKKYNSEMFKIKHSNSKINVGRKILLSEMQKIILDEVLPFISSMKKRYITDEEKKSLAYDLIKYRIIGHKIKNKEDYKEALSKIKSIELGDVLSKYKSNPNHNDNYWDYSFFLLDYIGLGVNSVDDNISYEKEVYKNNKYSLVSFKLKDTSSFITSKKIHNYLFNQIKDRLDASNLKKIA